MFNPFQKTYTDQEIVQFEFLRNFGLFASLSNKELSLFLPYIHERSYLKDEVVFFRNDPSHAMYLLKKGKVSLTLDIDENFEELGELSHYEMLGENCVIQGTKRPMNAIVSSETASFGVIPQDNIFYIFESHPEVKCKMLEEFARVNENHLKMVFKHYRSAFGLFNLSEVFKQP